MTHDAGPHEAFRLNRLHWDERVDTHFRSAMYQAHLRDLERGAACLDPEHVTRLGDVTGKSLLHLQCHLGMETLSWARLGARVTGVDFSPPALARAEEVAAKLRIPARFVCANVYDAPRILQERFDIVFVSVGALCWLPDLAGWAAVVSEVLNPGGTLYMNEVHPFLDVLDDDPTESVLVAKHPYFHSEAMLFSEDGTYADLDAKFEQNDNITWMHPLGAVVNSLIAHGLTIRALHESPVCMWPRYKQMREITPNRFELTGPLAGKLPMTFTLVATRDGGVPPPSIPKAV